MSKVELKVIEGTKDQQPQASAPKRYGTQDRWTQQLGRHFTPVSDYFLANYHRLKPHENAKGLNSAEAMLVIQLMSFKRDHRAPFPSHSTLAQRMGVSERMVRSYVRSLVDLGYLRCERKTAGGVNRYYLDPLFTALEILMSQDADSVELEHAS